MIQNRFNDNIACIYFKSSTSEMTKNPELIKKITKKIQNMTDAAE